MVLGKQGEMTDFVIRILERLNESVDLFIPVTDLLADIRAYFEFGCGFVYVANHKGEYTLEEHSGPLS